MKMRIFTVAALSMLASRPALSQTTPYPIVGNYANATVEQDDLIARLRGDPVEEGRYQAAVNLGKEYFATKQVIAALLIAASGDCIDGDSPEPSNRVRLAATQSLQICLREKLRRGPSQITAYQPSKVQIASYYTETVANVSDVELTAQALRFLAENLSVLPDNTRIFDEANLIPRPLGKTAGPLVAPWPPLNKTSAQPRLSFSLTAPPPILRPGG